MQSCVFTAFSEVRTEPCVRIMARQYHRLIADPPGRSIDRIRVASIRFEIRFLARHEKAAHLVQPMQPLEVEEASIHYVIGTRPWQDQIEHLDRKSNFAGRRP